MPEPDDAGHSEVPADLLAIHEGMEFAGAREFTEADHGPGPEQATALTEQDVDG